MRRWLSVLIVGICALQFVWGAAAAQCRHERGAAADHFGHHEHAHSETVEVEPAPSPDTGTGAADPPLDDPDCTACHLCCAQAVGRAAAASAASPAPPHPAHRHVPAASTWISNIERPQWHRAG